MDTSRPVVSRAPCTATMLRCDMSAVAIGATAVPVCRPPRQQQPAGPAALKQRQVQNYAERIVAARAGGGGAGAELSGEGNVPFEFRFELIRDGAETARTRMD